MYIRKTKVVCTIGPASSPPEIMRALILGGMNVARINFSHGTQEEHLTRVTDLKKLRSELDKPVALLADTKGPEIRIKTFKEGSVKLDAGQSFTITTKEVEGTDKIVSVSYNDFPKVVKKGARIMIDDGLIELRAEAVNDTDVMCNVVNGGFLSDRKSINLPGTKTNMPYMDESDKIDIKFAYDNDFDYIALSFVRSPDDVITTVLELVASRLPKYMKLDVLQDIQVLTPMRKSSLGVTSLNAALQQRLNPPGKGKKEREFRSALFREGDKVMQIKNNYDISWYSYDARGRRTDEGEGVFNGDCGLVKSIDEQNETVRVLFDDNRTVDYDFSQLEELDLAYAVTIHKSQGSEYRVVVIPVHSGPPMLLSRNLLYTAVTRARQLAVLVGVPETLYRMVDNNREVNRCTALERRIKKLFDGDMEE